MANDYTVDPNSLRCGMIKTGANSYVWRRRGIVGGGILIECLAISDGGGTSGVTIPNDFKIERIDGGSIDGADPTETYNVEVWDPNTDGTGWGTCDAIKAVLDVP